MNHSGLPARTFRISLTVALLAAAVQVSAAVNNPPDLDIEITDVKVVAGTGHLIDGTTLDVSTNADWVAFVGTEIDVTRLVTISRPELTPTAWLRLKDGEPADIITIDDNAHGTELTKTGRIICEKPGEVVLEARVTFSGVYDTDTIRIAVVQLDSWTLEDAEDDTDTITDNTLNDGAPDDILYVEDVGNEPPPVGITSVSTSQESNDEATPQVSAVTITAAADDDEPADTGVVMKPKLKPAAYATSETLLAYIKWKIKSDPDGSWDATSGDFANVTDTVYFAYPGADPVDAKRKFDFIAWYDRDEDGAPAGDDGDGSGGGSGSGADEDSTEGTVVTPRAVIRFDDDGTGSNKLTDVSGQKKEVVVGQQIPLQVELLGADEVTVTQFDWTIPGTRVGGYTANMTTASVTALPALSVAGNQKKHDITIYWVLDFVDKDVVGVFTTDKGKFTATTTFTVVRPTSTLTATSGVQPTVAQAPNGLVAIGLFTVGANAAPGITFNETATVAAKHAGATEFWQIINRTSVDITQISGINANPGQGGGFSLAFARDRGVFNNAFDRSFPYPALTGQGAVPTSNQSTIDSPASPDSRISHYSRTDTFSMYTMFKPAVAGSIWVPLRRLDWGWSVDVSIPWQIIQNGQNVALAGPSVFVVRQGPPAHITSVDERSHPVWSQNITSFTPTPVP